MVSEAERERDADGEAKAMTETRLFSPTTAKMSDNNKTHTLRLSFLPSFTHLHNGIHFAEFRQFLVLFGQCVNISPFDVIYFIQDLLADREQWIIDKEQTLLVARPRDSIWGALHASLEKELDDDAA